MDLIYTTYIPCPTGRPAERSEASRKWFDTSSGGLSCVSSLNVLLFSTSLPHPSTSSSPPPPPPSHHSVPASAAASRGGGAQSAPAAAASAAASSGGGDGFSYHLFLCDLNTPWDLHCVTSRTSEITALAWDESGTALVAADAEGYVEIWQMVEGVLSQWKCVARERMSQEVFIAAKFVFKGRKTYLNNEQMESNLFNEKFLCVAGPSLGVPFGQRGLIACVLVSCTSLVVAIAVNSDSGVTQVASKCMGGARTKLKHATMAYFQDGKLIVAVGNGIPMQPIRMYNLIPELVNQDELQITAEEFPAIFLQSQSKQDDDACQSIVDLCFVKGEDCDAILVATEHPSGGRVELWELKSVAHASHKIFTTAAGESPTARVSTPMWQYVEVFTGPASQVVSMATPVSTLQTGPGSPCYVTVAYSDGTIQCLLRDSLQQIGSVDLPKTGNLWEDSSSSKMLPRISVNICSMSFTATGNALVAIDSLGQLYLYKMSPISDPGGPHTVPYLVTLFEYCLVSGNDFWDLTICTKPAHIDQLCEKLTENFDLQPSSLQQYYYARAMAIKMTLYSLSYHGEHKASDCNSLLMLNSASGAFRTLLRTAESSGNIAEKNNVTFERLTKLLDSKKDESDVDQILAMLQNVQQEFLINPATVLSFHHLIQWTATLALHLMASIPEYKLRKGPGYDLHTNPKVLGTLRQLLLLIRLWGSIKENCQPSFTKTDDSFDVIATLFTLVTKLSENPNDETLLDACLRLPSQVLLPPLHMNLRPRGVAPSVVAFHKTTPLSFEFGTEPDTEISTQEVPFVEGAMATNQVIDCVKQTFLGKNPYSVKQCTRSHGVTAFHPSAGQQTTERFWDARWQRHSPYGGNWRTKFLTK